MLNKSLRTTFAVACLIIIFYCSKQHSYMLFHTLVELFSIVVAFAVFIVAWNSRDMQDNKYLHLVGISYIFIGALDLLHTLSFKGMNILGVSGFPANQFWVATRAMEAITLLAGFMAMNRRRKLNTEMIFVVYLIISIFITCSILVWRNFPVCFVEGEGQTDFKVYSEYIIILWLIIAAVWLYVKRSAFSKKVYPLLLAAIIFSILSECCFASYTTNHGFVNELGHYGKLIAFFLIYKANVETGFLRPTDFIFRNLKESEVQYRTLAENLPGIVMRFNNQPECIYHNLKDNHSVTINAITTQIKAVLSEALRTGNGQSGTFGLEVNHQNRQFAYQVVPERVAEGSSGGLLMIASDVTELRNAEQQLISLSNTRDKLFSVIAHDLRNPFTSILAYSDLLALRAGNMDTERIKQMARRINDTGKQTYALLENLLEWSRVQTGALKPQIEPVLAGTLLEEVSLLSAGMLAAKQISLRVDAIAGLIVLADKRMISTVLRNLLSNAVKFSHSGNEILISLKQEDNKVVFAVHDNGIGIETHKQAHLLSGSGTYSSEGTAAESGTGLGLVLCREFIQLNNGEIWFESTAGSGTVFFFNLPLA